MDAKLNILLVEDSDSDADLLIRFLNREKINFDHNRVWARDTFEQALDKNSYDLIISDQSLPQFSGMEAFRITKTKTRKTPFILVTGTVSESLLAEFAKEGVDDYLLKDNLLRLPSAIKHLLSTKKIEELHKKLGAAHKDIQDSIRYAKRIQNARLPDKDLLPSIFPESFILFKPKDIVSGDFYWLKRIGEVLYIAVADCTGHGVPGALMSMICSEKLDEAVWQCAGTSAILSHVNTGVKQTLHQSEDESTSKDGMDIAMCAIDLKEHTVKYSGANRPLYIIRKDAGMVEEVKATKKAIGGFTPGDQKYEEHLLQVQPGDSLYMATDGYADQFGGQWGKKIMAKVLKQKLVDIQSEPMQTQKSSLTDFLEVWKSEAEQVDDVLVLGLRF